MHAASPRPHIAVVGALALLACRGHDIGQACPQLLRGQDPGQSSGNRAESEEVIEQNPGFPCESLICVATASRPGYCSKKCRSDVSCPDGFECRVLHEVGPFANQGYCVWRGCETAVECGKEDEFCCVSSQSEGPNAERKYCAFSDDGICS